MDISILRLDRLDIKYAIVNKLTVLKEFHDIYTHVLKKIQNFKDLTGFIQWLMNQAAFNLIERSLDELYKMKGFL